MISCPFKFYFSVFVIEFVCERIAYFSDMTGRCLNFRQKIIDSDNFPVGGLFLAVS